MIMQHLVLQNLKIGILSALPDFCDHLKFTHAVAV